MKVLKNKRKNNTVSIEVEESHDSLNSGLEVAYRRLVKKANVKGFRKGKVPRNVFEKTYGKEVLIQEAIMDVVNDAYRSAITELELQVIDYPKNLKVEEYKENQPIKFSCDIEVMPELKLGKYKGLKVDKEDPTVKDADIQDQIDRLRENFAEYKPVEREAKDGDIVRCDIEAKIDDQPLEKWTRQNAGMKIGQKAYGSDFDTEIVGLKTNDSKTFTSAFGDDFNDSEIAGKKVTFNVTLKEIREKTLPPVDDEFIKKVSQDHTTVEDYKNALKADLSKQKERESEDKLRVDLMEKIIEDVKVDVQDVLIEREIDNMLQDFERSLAQSGLNLDRYSEITAKTKDGLRNDFREDALKRIKSELSIEAIAEKEKIAATDDDVKAEIKSWNLPKVQTDEEIDTYLKKINPEQMKTMLKTKKTMEFIIENAKITKK